MAVEAATTVPREVVEILSNDVNTAGAIAELHGLANRDDWAGLKAAMRLIGLPDAELVDWFREATNSKLWALLDRWQSLRNARNYADADQLKARIEACGVKLSVGVAGPEASKTDHFDPAKLEALK